MLDVQGQLYKVVNRNVGCKVLGTVVTLNGNVDAEFEARIAAAWAVSSTQTVTLQKGCRLEDADAAVRRYGEQNSIVVQRVLGTDGEAAARAL